MKKDDGVIYIVEGEKDSGGNPASRALNAGLNFASGMFGKAVGTAQGLGDTVKNTHVFGSKNQHELNMKWANTLDKKIEKVAGPYYVENNITDVDRAVWLLKDYSGTSAVLPAGATFLRGVKGHNTTHGNAVDNVIRPHIDSLKTSAQPFYGSVKDLFIALAEEIGKSKTPTIEDGKGLFDVLEVIKAHTDVDYFECTKPVADAVVEEADSLSSSHSGSMSSYSSSS